ncbi:MAG TPA: ATP-binding protein [Terriglobales bacterium]|nr:ATP-binding protein [Terriglobales bacterium]
MRSLFLKIFLSYWVAQALFLVLAILVTLALRPPGELATWQTLDSHILNDAVAAYEKGGTEALRSYLRSVHDARNVHLYLFTQNGQELTGRKAPDWVEDVLQGRKRTADSFWGRMRPIQFLRQSVQAADGRRYTLVTELPPGRTAMFGPHGVPGLGLLIGLVSSGLICYLLARYLTAPVVRLREATRQLAAGDLGARAGNEGRLTRRHDEIAELVRDFDTMAERLEKLVKAQSRLLNDISHELRSPLARLSVALALARRRAGTDAQATLDRIELEADRLNELIGRLLTVARLEGDEIIQRTPLDLAALVEEVVTDANFEAQARDCRVDFCSKGEARVMGNPTLLRSAVENVVRNAIRYTREGSVVEVRLEPQGDPPGSEIALRVMDSGPGVPEESLDKLFRPFYRIDDDRGRTTGGVGLGLAITERAVRLHGGRAKASNRAEGGLVVEIFLPALSAEGEEIPEEQPAPVAGDRA